MGVLICKQIKNTNYHAIIAAKDVYEQWVDTNARILNQPDDLFFVDETEHSIITNAPRIK